MEDCLQFISPGKSGIKCDRLIKECQRKDDVVVTAEGVEVLTGVLPTSVDEVEEAVGR